MSDERECKSLTAKQRATCCPNEICLCDEEDKFNPPYCHFKPMSHDASDCEEWWECKHCGHTKHICYTPQY